MLPVQDPKQVEGASWFCEESQSLPAPIMNISIIKLTVISCTILLGVVILLSAYPFAMENKLSWMHLICVPIFGATQFALMMGLICSLGLAVKMYRATGQFWTRADDTLQKDMSIFNTLAIRHKHMSQLWFNIAVAIILVD
jgi:hypothetical protein